MRRRDLLLAGLVAASVRPGHASAGPTPDASALTVVAVLDVTGAGAAIGDAERVGLRVAEREIAGQGGVAGRALRLVVLDSATTLAAARRAARLAIEHEHALVLVGASTAPSTAALAEAAERAEVPLLALAEGRPAGEPPWVFAVTPTAAQVADALARDLARRGLTRVGWLEAEGSIGQAGRAAFEAAARRHGLTVAARQTVAEATDPAAAVGEVAAAAPQAVVVWAIPPLAGAVAQAVSDVAPGVPHYQSHAAAAGSFLPLAGAAAAGIRTVQVRLPLAETLPEDDPRRPRLVDFLGRLRAAGGGGTSAFAGFAADALHLAAEALRKAGGADAATTLAARRFAIRGALAGIRDYAGLTGTYTFGGDTGVGLSDDALVLVEAVLPPSAKLAEWRPARQGAR
jgi:branched-chain amino acid transport system substrate-binding protein